MSRTSLPPVAEYGWQVQKRSKLKINATLHPDLPAESAEGGASRQVGISCLHAKVHATVQVYLR
ncbi:MAG: hypothetical protein KKH32_04985, partial [Bacteroidetes bacterium]|nr:hypothetical protein [Bacteroidota bacterium]